MSRESRAILRRTAALIGSQADRYVPRLRASLTQGLTVFFFHEITDRPSEFQRLTAGYTTPDVFRKQITWIGERFEFVAPASLSQLGGSGELPGRAALITFDDAWAGVFRTGLPILTALGVPSLCFLNMGTVEGMPDLSAVRRYERSRPPAGGPRLMRPVTAAEADALLDDIAADYRADEDFKSFQGPTATHADLANGAEHGTAWFGSHLYHHWDLHQIDDDLFFSSVRANAEALSAFSNSLPALATPYGHQVARLSGVLAAEFGVPLAFVATGAQNRNPRAAVLDRLALQPEPSGPADWWYSTHRRRLFRGLVH